MSLINMVYYSTTFGVKIFFVWSDTDWNERLCLQVCPLVQSSCHATRLVMLQLYQPPGHPQSGS